jgi:hypothetical protein
VSVVSGDTMAPVSDDDLLLKSNACADSASVSG